MRSAIIGCGSIAGVHAAVLAQSEFTCLASCADILPQRAQKMGEAFHIPAYFSLDEMLEKEKPDVLHILTPHHLHVPMAKMALERGIHVFMEKPPALDASEFSELLLASGHSGLYTGVCFQNRCNPQVQYIKEAIESGTAGRVQGARCFVTWARDDKYYTESGWRGQKATEGGGALINQSIHTMDLLVYLLGAPTAVEASMHNRHLQGIIEVEDTVEAYIRFEDKTALFFASTAYVTDAPVMVEIVCENAAFIMQGDEVTVKKSNGESSVMHIQPPPVLGKGYWGGSHKLCIDDFYKALALGKPYQLSPLDIAPTMDLVYGCYQSAKTGKPVMLKARRKL